MFTLFVILLILIPVLEIWMFAVVWQSIGGLATLLSLLALSFLGMWIVTRQGIGVWTKFQAKVSKGEPPHKELLDAMILLVAGVFLVFPGFLTDIVGLVLLLPPTRAAVRALFKGRALKRLAMVTPVGGAVRYYTWGSRGVRIVDGFRRRDAVIDVDSYEVRATPPHPPELHR